MSIQKNYFPTWKQNNYSEHKGTKVEDFNLEEKNRFNRNKDNVIDNMIAWGEETIPEKEMQLPKDFLIPFSTLQNYLTQQLEFEIMVLRT